MLDRPYLFVPVPLRKPAMQIVGRRYDNGDAVAIEIVRGSIARVELSSAVDGTTLPWIAPGFVDLQVNGYGGQSFNDRELTAEKVRQVSLWMDQDGVTRYCPTTTTDGFDVLSHALKTIAAACESFPEVDCRVAGIHVEGPYISSEDGPRGAHPRQHCRPPDWDEFQRLQDAAGGRVRILTLSPEYDGAAQFIAKVADSGVLVAIGHTGANSEQIRAAVDAGARMSTHLGNGAHGQIRRHPNYIWDQLADDRLVASLIADGHHLPATVVKSFVRAKTPERCVLVSDITSMAGMPPGRYETVGLGAVELLEGGRLVVAGQSQYLAGAALPIGVCVANVMRFAGVDLATAIEMASIRPAELIGESPAGLHRGSPADLVLFDLASHTGNDGPITLHVRATIKAGEVVHGAV
jgi:N-acetylglucosamine-6-phosphate deacetylase